MAYTCARCGKGIMRGHKVSHSGIRTKRLFRPNLHAFWVVEEGRRVRKRFCTKCLRIVKKAVRQAQAKQTQAVGSPA